MSTPVSTGRASSVEAAGRTWPMAVSISSRGSLIASPSAGCGPGGNSSASVVRRAVLARPALMRSWFSFSVPVSRSSRSSLTTPASSFAGTVVAPASPTSAGTLTRTPTSRSVAVSVKPSAVASSSTWPRIGRVARCGTTRTTAVSALPSSFTSQSNFMSSPLAARVGSWMSIASWPMQPPVGGRRSAPDRRSCPVGWSGSRSADSCCDASGVRSGTGRRRPPGRPGIGNPATVAAWRAPAAARQRSASQR